MPNSEITEEEIPDEETLSSKEELPGEEAFPDEEKMETEINIAGAEAGISPLDPDFLLFALPFAFAIDSLDVVLEIAGIFTGGITKAIGIVIDVVVLLILGGWLYWRTGEIAKSKRDRVATLRKTVQKGIKQLSKLQKIGKVPPKVFERYMRLYGKQMGKIGRAAARTAGKPLTKVLIRGGLTFLGELAFILGIIPFWTIMVVLALREK